MNELIDLDHGWEFIEAWITRILERLPETHVSPEEYMILYTAIYNMCERPHDYSQQMYNRYRNTFREYITSTVLPSLREKDDEFLLREFVNRWANHKVMMWWLSRVFRYLNQHFIPLWNLPGLDEVGLTCYQDLVCQQLKVKVRDAVISLIDQEREGEQIDQALLKNVLNVFEETGMGQMDQYEEAMLRDTEDYYSRKASNWILDDSCPDYMLKVEDFSRMCRLFFKIPKDLNRVSNIFNQYVTNEGTALVKQAEDAASNKKEVHDCSQITENLLLHG